ncbi:MAG: N-acetylmuramidase domain-containing protein [Paracoccaceae bacterium]
MTERNWDMAFDAEVIAQIRTVAEEKGIEPEALIAVTEVESGGRAYTTVNDKRLPLILFEYHVFYRCLPPELRAEAVKRNLARKRWGDLPYKKGQPARYSQLERAKEIHEDAAYAACSWGIGQVLGENAEWLGYGSAKALAEEAMSSVAGQVRVMVRFVEKAGLMDELARHDWRGFARRYNGPGQVDKYSELMARAYAKHGGSKTVAPDDTVLRIGAKGDEVMVLQNALRALGYHLHLDGDFGPATRRMVMEFQRDNDQVVDGIIGPQTWGLIETLAGRDVSEFV